MARPPVAIALTLSVFAVAPAAADPDPLPDLSGFTVAQPEDFGKYYNYPTTYGVNFGTPGGYRCRITYTWKANPNVKDAHCWGDLPGTASNAVFVRLATDADPARFADVDLAEMEKYSPPPPHVHPEQTVDPGSYTLLPAGSKLTFSGSATCAAADAMTVCVLGEHGFVLKPDGSRAF